MGFYPLVGPYAKMFVEPPRAKNYRCILLPATPISFEAELLHLAEELKTLLDELEGK